MRIPLGLAALILIVAGLAGCVSGLRPTNGTPDSDEHGDHHADGSGIPGAALIALVPLAVLAILRPPALDDAAADSVAPAASQTQQDAGIQVRPLPGDPDVPQAISFNELTIRGQRRHGPPTLRGRTLSLEGFVPKNQDGVPPGLVRIGRYMIWCRAADATFGEAFVRWPTGVPALAAGSWFRFIGRVHDVKTFDGLTVAVIDVTRVQAEPPPAHPYEY